MNGIEFVLVASRYLRKTRSRKSICIRWYRRRIYFDFFYCNASPSITPWFQFNNNNCNQMAFLFLTFNNSSHVLIYLKKINSKTHAILCIEGEIRVRWLVWTALKWVSWCYYIDICVLLRIKSSINFQCLSLSKSGNCLIVGTRVEERSSKKLNKTFSFILNIGIFIFVVVKTTARIHEILWINLTFQCIFTI